MKISKGKLIRIYFIGGTTVEGKCYKQDKKSITLKSDNGNILHVPNMNHVTMIHIINANTLIQTQPIIPEPRDVIVEDRISPSFVNDEELPPFVEDEYEATPLPPSLKERASRLKEMRMKKNFTSISDNLKSSLNESFSVK